MNSVDPDQTFLERDVWVGSTIFATSPASLDIGLKLDLFKF